LSRSPNGSTGAAVVLIAGRAEVVVAFVGAALLGLLVI
jgi:hypothetical protein